MIERSLPISVIVPTYFGGEGLVACVHALLRELAPDDEIIVVADGPSDGAWERLDATRVQTLVCPERRGPAAARNRGAELAQGDLLLFIDADCVVRPGMVERIRSAFEADASLTATIGSYDNAPAHPAFSSQYRNLLHHFVHQQSRDVIHTFWGACGAVRREAFFLVGGFDERFSQPCIEDIEFGYRLSAAGGRIQMLKDAQLQHLKAWTASSIIRTDIFLRAAPWTELLLRYRTIEDNLNTSRRSRVSVATVGIGIALAATALLSVAFGAFEMAGWTALGALLAAGAAVAFNQPFYRFLRENRGAAFAVRAAPWHLLYLTCAGVGALVGAYRSVRGRPLAPGAQVPLRARQSQRALAHAA